jgi:hypothetical protein
MSDIDIRTEPGNHTFAAWFDADGDPYAIFRRIDRHSGGGPARWFNTDQHDGDTETMTWPDLCKELAGLNGPFRLVFASTDPTGNEVTW